MLKATASGMKAELTVSVMITTSQSRSTQPGTDPVNPSKTVITDTDTTATQSTVKASATLAVSQEKVDKAKQDKAKAASADPTPTYSPPPGEN